MGHKSTIRRRPRKCFVARPPSSHAVLHEDPTSLATARLIPAAQYLRMSTEHQQYSFENQEAVIQEYAKGHGFEIVRAYSDAAKSGVILKNRAGLQTLLKDVVGGNSSYKAVLVYDVSRWGRFQDNDEAACYEFLCRRSGIPIHYCAESFGNDPTAASSILKSLKRTMAAEYSRELSNNVYEAKARAVSKGFGPADGLLTVLAV